MTKTKNYTSINHLIDKLKKEYISVPIESEPIRIKTKEEIGDIPIIAETEKEHEVPEEIKPYVRINQDTLDIPPDLQKFGLKPVSPSSSSIFQSIKLPISDDKVMQGLHKPVTSSWRWLSELSIFLLRQAHLMLRTVHGHVVRVIK